VATVRYHLDQALDHALEYDPDTGDGMAALLQCHEHLGLALSRVREEGVEAMVRTTQRYGLTAATELVSDSTQQTQEAIATAQRVCLLTAAVPEQVSPIVGHSEHACDLWGSVLTVVMGFDVAEFRPPVLIEQETTEK